VVRERAFCPCRCLRRSRFARWVPAGDDSGVVVGEVAGQFAVGAGLGQEGPWPCSRRWRSRRRRRYSASVTALWLFAARVNITEYVAQARPCPCCGTVTEGSYRNMCGRGPASAGDLRAGREPDGWAPDFGPAGNAAAAPVPRHRRLGGMDGRDPREDRRAGVAACGFMGRAREPLKAASAIDADEPPNRRRDQTSACQPLERTAGLSLAAACSGAWVPQVRSAGTSLMQAS
jgi:hypothetical protein